VNAIYRARTDSVLLRSALALAARGWLVFPCVPSGKRPALRGNWQNLATTSPDQVNAWWAKTPYNIGTACGPSGLVVIDLDVPHLRGRSEPASPALCCFFPGRGQEICRPGRPVCARLARLRCLPPGGREGRDRRQRGGAPFPAFKANFGTE